MITCKKCREEIPVDGEYPKFFAWCFTCDDYADFDLEDYIGGLIDQVMQDR